KQRTSNQTQELRHNISKKDKAIVKWLGLEDQELVCLIRQMAETYDWIEYKLASKQIVSLEETDLIQGSDSTHKNTQPHLNTKEVLILAECGIMDYGTLELQEALNNNTDKNAASKRKVDPESPQEDTNKQSLTLTETIIQNSKCFKEDSTVLAQQITESTILSRKDEQPISKTKNEDIYSSQWAVTRNEAKASQKPILSPKIKQENKNTNAAYIKLEYRSEKERTILENSWSIHYNTGRLCRITLGCFNKKVLIERNRFKAKITNIPNHTPETALLRQLKSHKVETLHIPLNSNNNQSSIAWLYFSSQVDLENSINSTLYCYNTKLVWSKAVSIIGTNKLKNIGTRKNSLRESLSDKTNTSSSTQRITEVGKQTYSLFSSEKRPRSDSRSSSKERSRPNKSSLKISEPDQVKTSLLTQTAIDRMWESFEDGIIFAAKKNILFKIVKGSQPDYKVKHKSKEKKGRLILHT
ncbi:2386_t:CDS:2, partial [Gigaspora margarita]